MKHLATCFYTLCSIIILSCSNIRHATEYTKKPPSGTYEEVIDEEGFLFSQRTYDTYLGRYSTKYFTRNGDTLTTNNYYFETDIIKSIQDKLSLELENDESCLSGQALLYIIYDPDRNIKEIRLLRGIDSMFNSRLIQIIKQKGKELLNSATQTSTVVTPFPLVIK